MRGRYLVLLVAILPSLSFLDHWSVNVDVAGINLVLIEAIHHEDEQAARDDQPAHTNHCHANAASCTDVPFTGASPFALLHDSIAYLGAAAVLVVLLIGTWRPWATLTVGPELRPPRRTDRAFVSSFAAGF